MDVIDNRKIILKFPFSKQHIARMELFPFYYWDKEKKHWTFPYSVSIKKSIEQYFRQYGYEIESYTVSVKVTERKKNFANDRKIPAYWTPDFFFE